MEKCLKCGRPLTDDDLIYWKCIECGKVFTASLSKLKKLQKQKQMHPGQALLKCLGCGYGIDDGKERMIYKCPECGSTTKGNLNSFIPVHGDVLHENEHTKNIVQNKQAPSLKCPNCGNVISKQTNCCSECGYSVISSKKHKSKKNKVIVVGTLFLLLALFVPIILIHFEVIHNPFGTQSNLKQKIDFESLGLSEDCYTETLQLINEYYSEDFENKIKEVYLYHGTDSYDNEKATNEIDNIEREIKDKYYQIYSSYDHENDKQIVLFGYNFSLFCELQYSGNALNVPQINYNETMEDYYNQYVSMPSLELVNNFCAYITTNNVMDYASNIHKATREDVADSICTDIKLANISLSLSTYYIEKRNITSAYSEFCNFADYYQKVLDKIEENKEFKKDFLSKDISFAREILDDSKQYYKNFADAYSRKDNSSIVKYTERLMGYLDEIIMIVDEIEKNAKNYSKSV